MQPTARADRQAAQGTGGAQVSLTSVNRAVTRVVKQGSDLSRSTGSAGNWRCSGQSYQCEQGSNKSC